MRKKLTAQQALIELNKRYLRFLKAYYRRDRKKCIRLVHNIRALTAIIINDEETAVIVKRNAQAKLAQYTEMLR